MRTYTIVPVTDDVSWQDVPWLWVDNHQWGTETDIRMGGQICYSEKGLHVHLQAWEKDIRAEHNSPLAPVCQDSCMEFFLSPMADDPRYFNIEMNPLGCTYLGFGVNLPELIRLMGEGHFLLEDRRTAYTEDGWEVFYTIPLDFIRLFFPEFDLTTGRKLRANCYKCGELTPKPHYISWNRIDSPTPAFHVRRDFGEMVLG